MVYTRWPTANRCNRYLRLATWGQWRCENSQRTVSLPPRGHWYVARYRHSLSSCFPRGAQSGVKKSSARIYIGDCGCAQLERTPVCVYLCLYTSTPPFASASKSEARSLARTLSFSLSLSQLWSSKIESFSSAHRSCAPLILVITRHWCIFNAAAGHFTWLAESQQSEVSARPLGATFVMHALILTYRRWIAKYFCTWVRMFSKLWSECFSARYLKLFVFVGVEAFWYSCIRVANNCISLQFHVQFYYFPYWKSFIQLQFVFIDIS